MAPSPPPPFAFPTKRASATSISSGQTNLVVVLIPIFVAFFCLCIILMTLLRRQRRLRRAKIAAAIPKNSSYRSGKHTRMDSPRFIVESSLPSVEAAPSTVMVTEQRSGAEGCATIPSLSLRNLSATVPEESPAAESKGMCIQDCSARGLGSARACSEAPWPRMLPKEELHATEEEGVGRRALRFSKEAVDASKRRALRFSREAADATAKTVGEMIRRPSREGRFSKEEVVPFAQMQIESVLEDQTLMVVEVVEEKKKLPAAASTAVLANVLA